MAADKLRRLVYRGETNPCTAKPDDADLIRRVTKEGGPDWVVDFPNKLGQLEEEEEEEGKRPNAVNGNDKADLRDVLDRVYSNKRLSTKRPMGRRMVMIALHNVSMLARARASLEDEILKTMVVMALNYPKLLLCASNRIKRI